MLRTVSDDKTFPSCTTTATSSAETVLSVPPSLPPSPGGRSSTQKAAASRRDEGAQYLSRAELPGFDSPPHESTVLTVMAGLGGSGDWSDQFGAIDDARRLVRHAPSVLIGSGHLKKLVGLIIGLVDSLRSALAKNALLCASELFVTFGKRLDPEIEVCLPVILRRAADTNAFISEAANGTMRDVCRHATEAKLMTPVLAAVTHRRAEIRSRATWCLAMLTQRSLQTAAKGGKGGDVRLLIEAAGKAISDANPEVRQFARVLASVLAGGGVLDDGPAGSKLRNAALPGLTDAFDVESVRRCMELSRTTTGAGGGAGRRTSNSATRACGSR